MTTEQVKELLGWDTKLPLSLVESLDALEASIKTHVLDDLGEKFLNMYIAFKRLEAKQESEKTEEQRLSTLSKIF